MDVTVESTAEPSVSEIAKVDKWWNFSRVLPDQLEYIELGNSRYQPIKVFKI